MGESVDGEKGRKERRRRRGAFVKGKVRVENQTDSGAASVRGAVDIGGQRYGYSVSAKTQRWSRRSERRSSAKTQGKCTGRWGKGGPNGWCYRESESVPGTNDNFAVSQRVECR